MVGVPRDATQRHSVQIRMDNRHAVPEHFGNRMMGPVWLRDVASLEFRNILSFRCVGMGGGHSMHAPVALHDIDDAPVGNGRHGEVCDTLNRGGIVQGFRERRASLREERRAEASHLGLDPGQLCLLAANLVTIARATAAVAPPFVAPPFAVGQYQSGRFLARLCPFGRRNERGRVRLTHPHCQERVSHGDPAERNYRRVAAV